MANYNLMANAVRMLAVDSIEKSKSGHPELRWVWHRNGTVLWRDQMRHNPLNPELVEP